MFDKIKDWLKHFKNGNKAKKHSFWFYFLNALCWSVIAGLLLFGGLEFADRKSGYKVLNSHIAVVVTESMSKVNEKNLSYLDENVEHIQIGDVIKAKEYKKFDDVNLYDVVIYKGEDGILICHRVVDKYVDPVKGECLVTRGDANTADDTPITFGICRGKVVKVTPKLGKVVMFMQTPYMLIAIFGSGFFVFLGLFIAGLSKDKKNKNGEEKPIENAESQVEESKESNTSEVVKAILLPLLVSAAGLTSLFGIGNASSLYTKGVSNTSFGITHGTTPITQVSVTFDVTATTEWGQNIYIAGIGDWDVDHYIALDCTDTYPQWHVTQTFDVGDSIEFKFVKYDGANTTWENGISNRTLTFQASDNGKTYTTNWDNSSYTFE